MCCELLVLLSQGHLVGLLLPLQLGLHRLQLASGLGPLLLTGVYSLPQDGKLGSAGLRARPQTEHQTAWGTRVAQAGQRTSRSLSWDCRPWAY